MSLTATPPRQSLEQSIKDEARRLGFILAGVTTPDPPPHVSVFEAWLSQGRQATMGYLATSRALERRRDPRLIMPDCRSILVLGVPYFHPSVPASTASGRKGGASFAKIAAYASGEDYHLVLPNRLKQIVRFTERQVGRPVASRWYADTGPILERDLAQRAGLGWIGKNTCLITPKIGSYLLLAEILLDLELQADAPFETDRCGTCTRCISACPTACILPDRTLDAGRCISYLTIEHKGEIPSELRASMGQWIFGCDICQIVCPWNRFAPPEGDPAFAAPGHAHHHDLMSQLEITVDEFDHRFERSPVRRAKHSGYRRNAAIALGNVAGPEALPALRGAAEDGNDPLVAEHAAWAIRRIRERAKADE